MKKLPPYLLNKDRSLCCSCRACEQKCPKHCISMQKEAGFRYPVIDSQNCIECGSCEAVCQYSENNGKNRENTKFNQLAYAAYNMDNKTVMGSSSGGIFPALAKHITENGGVVFGAKLNKELLVTIDWAESYEDCIAFCKSKYIFSNTDSSYSKVKEFLKDGRIVLFTGTPCQVSGLLHFLGKESKEGKEAKEAKEYDNLFTMDIVCHGFPSEDAFQAHKKELEMEAGGSAINVDFRHKIENKNCIYIRFEFDNSKIIEMPLADSPYSQTYFSHCSLMPSCTNCLYTSLNRVSDITAGDFWGVETEEPEAYNPSGTSAVIINSEKGMRLFKSIESQLFTKATDIKKIAAHNPQLCKPSAYNPFSDKFAKALETKSFSYCYKKYVKFGKYLLYPYRLARKIAKIVSR